MIAEKVPGGTPSRVSAQKGSTPESATKLQKKRLADATGAKMRQLTKDDEETIRLARSIIRDFSYGWEAKELAENPETVVERLTSILGDRYDFKTGDEG